MARSTRVLSLSLPSEIAQEFEKMAQAENKSKSQFFRDMIEGHKQNILIRQLRELQAYGTRKAAERGIFTEEDVEKLLQMNLTIGFWNVL